MPPKEVALLRWIGVGVGIFLLIAGLATRRCGPNPWFGFRTPHTLASERVWREVNRRAGGAFAALGAVLALGSLLGRGMGANFLAFFGFVLGMLLVLTVYYAFLAWRLYKAEGWEVPREEVSLWDFVPPRWEVLPVAILLSCLLWTLVVYPSLPQRIPVHFDLAGRPDGWARKSFLSVGGTVLLTAFFYALLTAFSWWTAKTSPPQAVLRGGSPEAERAFKTIVLRGLHAFKTLLVAFLAWFHFQVLQVALGARQKILIWPAFILFMAALAAVIAVSTLRLKGLRRKRA